MVLSVRELAPEELNQLREGQRPPLPTVKRLRDSHHMVARLWAFGLSPEQIALCSGYSRQRIWAFQRDPAFQQLAAEYAKDPEITKETYGFAQIIRDSSNSAMAKAVRHVHDYFDNLDEAGETAPLRSSLAAFAEFADRFGYSKKSTQYVINADFAAALDRAIDASAKAQEGQTLDLKAEKAA